MWLLDGTDLLNYFSVLRNILLLLMSGVWAASSLKCFEENPSYQGQTLKAKFSLFANILEHPTLMISNRSLKKVGNSSKDSRREQERLSTRYSVLLLHRR